MPGKKETALKNLERGRLVRAQKYKEEKKRALELLAEIEKVEKEKKPESEEEQDEESESEEEIVIKPKRRQQKPKQKVNLNSTLRKIPKTEVEELMDKIKELEDKIARNERPLTEEKAKPPPISVNIYNTEKKKDKQKDIPSLLKF